MGLASARERAECEMLMASNARREVEEEQGPIEEEKEPIEEEKGPAQEERCGSRKKVISPCHRTSDNPYFSLSQYKISLASVLY